MLRVKPFQGLRPADDLASLVACVPYDAVTLREAVALVADNPYSLLHVERAEVDLPETASALEISEKARETFQVFQAHEILVRESDACVYLYQQRIGDHAQTGIALTGYIEDYVRGIIRKGHEPTREKVDDCVRHIEAIKAQTTPVCLSYTDLPDLDALVAEVLNIPPLFDFTATDGVGHTVWRVPGAALGEFFVRAFAKVPEAQVIGGDYLADAALRIARERCKNNPDHTGEEPYNRFLCVLFPASQLGPDFTLLSGLFVHTLE